MNERNPHLDPPATDEEIARAGRFAEALESGEASPEEAGALSAARLLQALGEDPPGREFEARRTRADLVARASRTRRERLLRRLAAAAAVVAAALGALFFFRPDPPPAEDLLAAREEAAREAVAAVALSGSWDPRAERVRSQLEELRGERFDAAVRSQRSEVLSEAVGGAATAGSTDPGTRPGVVTTDEGGAS